MKVYLDNNIVSSIVRDDNASQSEALSRLLEAFEQDRVMLLTSALTLEEIRKSPDRYRAPLERTFRLLEKIPVASPTSLLYISIQDDLNSPVFQNDPLFASLLALGLDEVDANHIFSAAKESCDVFLTCDNSRVTGILRRASQINQLCRMRVERPSEFIASQGW